jgi:hypothetical protein
VDIAEHEPEWHHKSSFDSFQGDRMRAALARQ